MEASDQRQHLKLLLVASRHHLSSGDLRSLIQFLESDDCGFEVALQVAEPNTNPELLELHRLVVTPALIKPTGTKAGVRRKQHQSAAPRLDAALARR